VQAQLSDEEKAAYTALMRVVFAVPRVVTADIAPASGIGLSDHLVLQHLELAVAAGADAGHRVARPGADHEAGGDRRGARGRGAGRADVDGAHVRARFTFTDGGPDLRFTDQRTFGHLMMVPLAYPDDRSRVVPEPIVHIAADPLEAAFDAKDFAARLRRKKTQVKRALLDQSLISGVGNIYADEALWRAKLHWARPTETLKPSEVSRLLEAVRDVLTEALKAGGTSFDALYVNVNGESGYFDRSLHAYGREGEPCDRCATPIRRDAFMNRSSYSCPRCQK